MYLVLWLCSELRDYSYSRVIRVTFRMVSIEGRSNCQANQTRMAKEHMVAKRQSVQSIANSIWVFLAVLRRVHPSDCPDPTNDSVGWEDVLSSTPQ